MTDRDDSPFSSDAAAEEDRERLRARNPTIRALAHCLRRIDEILDSDYAYLHCSPERLQFIWDRLLEVSAALRQDVRPLLAAGSPSARLEEAQQSAAAALDMISGDLLASIDRFPGKLAEEDRPEVRRLLCSTLGQIHSFLADTLTELLTADQGDTEGSDYWPSMQLPRDIDESEWLSASVDRLAEYLDRLESERLPGLRPLAVRIQRGEESSGSASWAEIEDLLAEVLEVLVPRLRAVRALHSIRYDDMEVLDRYLLELPVVCLTIRELRALEDRLTQGLNDLEGDVASRAVATARALLSEPIGYKLDQIDHSLRDLVAFVGLWSRGIRKRRALQFREDG